MVNLASKQEVFIEGLENGRMGTGSGPRRIFYIILLK
jgi:hypothetical protein